MHRSSFRTKRQATPLATAREAPKSTTTSTDFAELREQIANLSRTLSPLKASVEHLAAPRDDISVPADIGASLKLLHSRLDKLEQQQADISSYQKRMSTTFSNAILKLADKVEKISGGEDSTFSLAHSLEKLTNVLGNRKFRVKRDNEGNMVSFEVQGSV